MLQERGSIVQFEKGNDYILLSDGTRVDLVEDNGLYYFHLEQIISPEEIDCMVAMTKPHLRPKILDNGMALAANIDVWHKRLHVSPKKIRAIYDLGAVEGLSINNLPKHGGKCKCEDCVIARASRSTVPKVRQYQPLADKPFHTVSTDIKTVNTTSLNGFNHSMNFVDEYSRYAHIYFMRSKTAAESKRVLEEFLSDVRRLGWRIQRLRSDLGSEYVNNKKDLTDTKPQFEAALSEFEKVCNRPENNIKFTQAPRGVSKLNGVVERYNRTLSELSNAFLYHGRVSPIFWEYAYRHSNWIYNRLIHSHLGKHSPFEIVFARRPRFDRLRTLFCDMYAVSYTHLTLPTICSV